MKTKEKILLSALDMFNNQGVELVTTRHIAKSLDISQGNLHYHYPNKNVLIIRLFEEFLKEVALAERYKGDVFKKEDIILSMKENFIVMFNYRFLFKDNEVIWRRLPELKTRIIGLFDLKREQLKQVINGLKEADVFRTDISQAQIDFLVDQFVFTISSWLSASEYVPSISNVTGYFAKYTYRHWLPYLKKNEMIAWEALIAGDDIG